MALTPADLGSMVERLQRERGDEDRVFDVAILGLADPSEPGRGAAYAEAGATWWLESLSPMRGSIEQLRAIVDAGPPTALLQQAGSVGSPRAARPGIDAAGRSPRVDRLDAALTNGGFSQPSV